MIASLLSSLTGDPVLGYSLLAAVFLAVISLVTGWSRLDFMALRPLGLLHVAVAVLIAAALVILGHVNLGLEQAGPAWIKALTTHHLWPLAGISQLPLFIVTLGYGPSAGLLAAGLFAAFIAPSGTLGWTEAVLALELVVLGWLAIFPSAFQRRWAGPLNVLLAYMLAQLTGGLALLEAQTGQVTAADLWRQQALGGILLSALLLFLMSPASYQRLFHGSRILPRPKGASAPPGRHDPASLTSFMLPELEHSRHEHRQHELEPPPLEDS